MKYLKAAESNETKALQKAREKYETEFLTHKDLHLFPETTREGQEIHFSKNH